MTTQEIIWIAIGAVVVFIVGLFISYLKKTSLTEAEVIAAEDAILNRKAVVEKLRAEVVDMACDVTSIGYQAYKQPKAVKQFCIKFRTGEEEIRDIFVSESLYDAFEVGQVGMLTLVDGHVDSFELEEG